MFEETQVFQRYTSGSSSLKEALHACRWSKDGFMSVELFEAVLLLIGCPQDEVKRLFANTRSITDGRVHIDGFIDWIMCSLLAVPGTEAQQKMMRVTVIKRGGEQELLAVLDCAAPAEIAASVAKHLCYEKCWLGCLKSLIPAREVQDRIFFAYCGLMCDVRGGLNWFDDIELEFIKSNKSCFIAKHVHRCW
eukprot:TRINITY_DN105687_c0_g1_i1.p1 TRINITY_DN105687_c0_g1~~TRINITY_DN105687_c0_g1_i1.p1  ORF type:complete len:192 (+),score=24.76 TRINITY_DN105687_c0_g1_i1:155-730(+)